MKYNKIIYNVLSKYKKVDMVGSQFILYNGLFLYNCKDSRIFVVSGSDILERDKGFVCFISNCLGISCTEDVISIIVEVSKELREYGYTVSELDTLFIKYYDKPTISRFSNSEDILEYIKSTDKYKSNTLSTENVDDVKGNVRGEELYKIIEKSINVDRINKDEIIKLCCSLLDKELSKVGIFKLDGCTLMYDCCWFNVSTGMSNTKKFGENFSFSSFLKACISQAGLEDSVNVEQLCDYSSYILLTMYCLLKGEYELHYDDLSRIEGYNIDQATFGDIIDYCVNFYNKTTTSKIKTSASTDESLKVVSISSDVCSDISSLNDTEEYLKSGIQEPSTTIEDNLEMVENCTDDVNKAYAQDDIEFDKTYFNSEEDSIDIQSHIQLNSDTSISVMLEDREVFTTFDVLLAKKVQDDVNINIKRLYGKLD